MAEIRDLGDLPEDSDLRYEIERAQEQIGNLKASLEYNFLTVQRITDDTGREVMALVAHNPCDLSQYHVAAFLPTMDDTLSSLKANEEAGREIAKLEEEMPEYIASLIFELCMRRIAHASENDPEAFVRITAADTFDEARKLYQEHYGLVGGGDFNHPLK